MMRTWREARPEAPRGSATGEDRVWQVQQELCRDYSRQVGDSDKHGEESCQWCGVLWEESAARDIVVSGLAAVLIVASVRIVVSGLAAVLIVASGLASVRIVVSGLAVVLIVASGLAAGHFRA